MKKSKFIIQLLLISQTIYCWICLLRARALPYDENYASIIHAIIISFIPIAALYFVWYYYEGNLKLNRYTILLWFIFGSPITFIVMAIYYSEIFGNLAT